LFFEHRGYEFEVLYLVAANGSGLGVRAGFSAENFERETKPKFTKNCRTGAFDLPGAKPLLYAAFSSVI